MEKREDTSKWLKFFKDAGIPTKTGASYALIFVENRINMDMLSDLTVDYLRLMGIKLMGDIIAILRHCKNVHQDSMRKVVILKSKEEPAEQSSSLSSDSSSSDSSSSSESEDERRVEISKNQNVKKAPTVFSKVSAKIEKRSPSPKDEVQLLKSKIVGKMNLVSLEKKSASEAVQASKRKHVEEKMEIDEAPVAKTVVLRSEQKFPSKPTAPLPKKLKVVTDNEYFGPKLPPVKKTIFDRLGAENDSPQVSSTTEVQQHKPEVVETKFTRIISNVNLPLKTVPVKNVTNSQTKVSSVFDRLGEQRKEPTEVKGSSLQYAGILKSSPPKSKPNPLINIIKRVGTMRADEPQLPVRLRTTGKPTVRKPADTFARVRDTSLKTRLKPIKINRAGLTTRKEKSASEGIFANPYSFKETVNVPAKERLGFTSKPLTNKSIRASTNKKLIRSSPMGSSNKIVINRIRNSLTHHLGMSEAKKVSFGRVEERTISPARSNLNFRGRNRSNINRPSVHSRLGVKRVV